MVVATVNVSVDFLSTSRYLEFRYFLYHKLEHGGQPSKRDGKFHLNDDKPFVVCRFIYIFIYYYLYNGRGG
jgi:hypothetical protein